VDTNTPADPDQPVIVTQRDAAEAFGAWWVTATDAERRAFADSHGDRARELKDRGELTTAKTPPTWRKT
jgi:hypothetical protein